MRFEKMVAVLSVSLAFALPGLARAAVITDVYDPDPAAYISTWNSPYTYQHNLLIHGYQAGTPITAASLDLDLFDAPFGNETVHLSFDGTPGGTITNVPFTLDGTNYSFGVQTSLLTDGLLNVSVSMGCNLSVLGTCVLPQDVILARSTLTVTTSDVPEPASAAVFGLGLLALSRVRRSRQS